MGRQTVWQQFQRARISRRRFLGAMATGAAGLAVAAACRESAPGAAEPPASLPVAPGGTYKFPVAGDWGTLDPVTSVGFGTYVFPLMYNALVDRSRLDAGYYYFDLAESLEQPDEETYVFHIRTGVRIAPNDLDVPERDLDAHDAAAWLTRLQDDARAVSHGFVKDWVSSFEAQDARTLVLRTNGPYAYALFRIGSPLGGTIPPREFFERDIKLVDRGAGGGPFVLEPGSYIENEGLRLARNRNYYRRAASGDVLPYFDAVEATRLSDRLTRSVAFGDKQVHVYDAEGRGEVNELDGQVDGLQVIEEPVNTFVSFVMNPARAPWTDERLRRAALHALNRQDFVDVIVGPGEGEPNGLVHWPLRDFALPPDELERLQRYDPAESRALIRAATGEDSIDIEVIYPMTDDEFHDRHVPIFLEQMREAGLNVRQKPGGIGDWLVKYQRLEYDATLALNQVYETAEIPLDFHSANGPQGGRIYATGIGGLYPEVEEAILASKRAADPAEHAQRVLDAQRLIYSKAPASLPIMSWMNYTLYQPFVRNVPRGLGSTGLYLTNEMWLDQDAM